MRDHSSLPANINNPAVLSSPASPPIPRNQPLEMHPSFQFLLLLLLLLLLLSLSLLASGDLATPAIGITYRTTIPGLPGPERVVSALHSAGIAHAHLPYPDPATLRAFLYSGISLLLSIPNSLVPDLASHPSAARRWLADHVLSFHPRIRIAAISVGHGILSSSSSSHNLSRSLLPAMRNIHSACLDLGLHNISVSTAHSFDVLDPAFPPSAARFNESLSKPYMQPLLDFLSSTGAPFLINIYPYEVDRANAAIPIGYALFDHEALSFRDDPGTGLRYHNLFDAMIDAAFGALRALGHREMPVVVSGTGWPSRGGKNEREATVEYARKYNGGLVQHLRSGLGTPMRGEGPVAVYIRELFDDPRRRGLESERHWGIWCANLTRKYEILFSGSPRGSWMNGAVWLFLCFCVALFLLSSWNALLV